VVLDLSDRWRLREITELAIRTQNQPADGEEIMRAMPTGKKLKWAAFYAALGILTITIGKLYVSPWLTQ
jgi:hypothetical protein